jgi:tRNA(adenine34) deaminase
MSTGRVLTDEDYVQRALLLARQAEAANEVPVGALVVVRGMVTGEGWNQPVGSHDPTAHAEIVALRAAAAHAGNYRLDSATLYASVQPSTPGWRGWSSEPGISRPVRAGVFSI